MSWYLQSAEQGNADAQFNLGEIYAKGWGVPQDDAQALAWHRKAAERGKVRASLAVEPLAPTPSPDAPVAVEPLAPTPETSDIAALRKAADQGHADAQTSLGSGKITKTFIWWLVVLIVAAGYWISKGTPNPVLFFTANSAKQECLRLANENKGTVLFLDDNETINANDTWLKDGKRVVQLLQKDGDGMNQIMCIYGNGMVEIPSILEQGRWR
jgi:hypothetical protein